MIKKLKIIISSVLVLAAPSCSQILQTINLELNSEDYSAQENFNVIEKVLTFEEADKQNKSSYNRMVLQPGRGNNARAIPEKFAVKSKFPNNEEKYEYRIGFGDTLTLSRLIENNHSKIIYDIEWPTNIGNFNYALGVGDNLALTLLREKTVLNRVASDDEDNDQNVMFKSQKETILETRGRIGSDGSVLFLEVGRLEAKGKSIKELQSEVRNILIRNGASPRFQLEIVEFKSQKAYLTINNQSSVISLDDQKTSLKDILTSANVGFKPGVITLVRLQRNGDEYKMPLRSIFGNNGPKITIYDRDHIFVESTETNVISSSSNVGNDGNVVFAGIGRIRAFDRTLTDLQADIYPLIEKIPGSQNAFQIEITGFSSQTAVVSIPEQEGGVIQITNAAVALDHILTDFGLSIDGKNITRINLVREGETYMFTLDDLLNSKEGQIYLRPNDRIKTETLSYKESKVFILGGVNPQIFKINPINRETLADVLFTANGPLSSASAKRSEVYLLRGKNPVIAYHLDAQSPTRLIVADAMELRPNDILYVAEQPIVSFNRTLATIIPLRILLRDIQDENIP